MSLKGVDLDQEQNIKKIPEKLSMIFLRKKEPEVTIAFSDSDLNKFEERIRATSVGIKENEFSACKGTYCEWCDYRDLLCPEFG